MSIYEYDAEKHIRMERAEAKEEGREEILTGQIKKKLAKGRSLHQIADELEMGEDIVRELIEKIESTP